MQQLWHTMGNVGLNHSLIFFFSRTAKCLESRDIVASHITVVLWDREGQWC